MGFKPEMYAERKAASREKILESGFRIFSEKTIDAVNLTEVADAANVGMATVYRHFGTKTALVLEIGTWIWSRYTRENWQKVENREMRASDFYEHFLDSFIDLYRNHQDILRFNQFFNVYVQREDIPKEQLQPYNRMIEGLARRFHRFYEMARVDGTLRTDIPENEMFSSTLHLMLAAVTRYAVGLVYDGGTNPEQELLFLKKMLMNACCTAP